MLGGRSISAIALALVLALASLSAVIGGAPGPGAEPDYPVWPGCKWSHGFFKLPDGTTNLTTETAANFNVILSIDFDKDGIFWPESTNGDDHLHFYSDEGNGVGDTGGYFDDSLINFGYYNYHIHYGEVGLDFRIWLNGSKFQGVDSQDGWCAYPGAVPQGDGTYAPEDCTFTWEEYLFDEEVDYQIPSGDVYPSIEDVFPSDGATDVSVNSADYVIRFSEPMNKTGTIDTNLPLITPWTWSSDGVWLNATYDSLENEKTYYVDLAGGNFENTIGLSLTGDMNKTFNTTFPGGFSTWSNPFQKSGIIYLPDSVTQLAGETRASFEIMLCVDADDDGKYWPEDGEDWYHTYSDEGMNGYGASCWLGGWGIDDSFIDFAWIVIDMQPTQPGGFGVYYKIWVNGSKFISMDSIDGYCAKVGSKTMNDGSYAPTDQLFQFPASGPSDQVDFQVPGFIPANETELNLTFGWNLLSFPTIQATLNGTPIKMASDLSNVTNCIELAKWNETNKNYTIYIPGFHLTTDPENFVIGENDAIFVWWNESNNGIYVVGGYLPGHQTVPLKTGWNSIAYKGQIAQDVTLWAAQVSCGVYDDICYFDGQRFVHYIFPGTEIELVPNRGYFVWSDIDTILVY